MTQSSKRVWIFGFAIFFLVLAVFMAQARVEHNYETSAAQHITLRVDSIDFRSDLTRLYGKLVGRPHTSQRVDAVTLNVGSKQYRSTDIDGVDFNRWFQWEDDGVIPVEIDFDKMPKFNKGYMVIETPRGVDRISITK